MDQVDWEDEFRPKAFGDVRGQPQAVKQVAGRIVRGLRPRAQILIGAVGSGKTSLVRIAAAALNCLSRLPDGSPCGACEFCENPSRYRFEWDTTLLGADKQTISTLIEQNCSAVGVSKYRVLFFDECHALSSDAQDALLKSVEETPAGMAFYFATTEPKKIKPSLLSRLQKVRIYPFSPDDALEYLEWIARQKGLVYDPEALHLLIAATPPYARDLIIGLQELAGLGEHITVDLVKDQLGLQLCDHLVAYMNSVALGDRASQVQTMKRWPDNIVEKRQWIERFISSAYYNDVLGVEYILDPLVHGLASQRREFVQGIRKRLQLNLQGLRHAFEAMMKFWSQHTSLIDSNVHLALALFEGMLNEGAVNLAKSLPKPEHGVVGLSMPTEVGRSKGERSESLLCSEYLSADEVRELVNRASFFAQEYGRYLNTTVTLSFESATNVEDLAERGVVAFLAALDETIVDRDLPFAAVATLEREQGRIVGRVLAYVSPKWRPRLSQFCASWGQPSSVVSECKFDSKDADCSFQRDAIRDICASCDEVSTEGRQIRRLLGVPRSLWRDAGPFAGSRVHFSNRLSDLAIEEASYPAVAPLQVFDTQMNRWSKSNWEIAESLERTREKSTRKRILKSLEFRWRDDPPRLNAVRAALLESWCAIAPEQRTRRRRGWL